MSMETRKGHGAYYTRSKRVAGRIIRTYVGSGLVAFEAAETDRASRLAKAMDRDCHQKSEKEARILDEMLAKYARDVDRMLEIELAVIGIHRRRSEWRVVR
jgi:hypothetical protein